MIVMDPRHLLSVDFSLSAIVALARRHEEGERTGYADRGRPDHGLMLVRRGGVQLFGVDGKTLCADPGDVIYFPKGGRYTVIFESRGEAAEEDILINFLMADDRGRELSLADELLCLGRGVTPETESDFLAVAGESPEADSVIWVKRRVLCLWERLLTDEAERRPESVIERCVAHIDTHHAHIDGVGELSALCGMSESAFRKKFREHMGMSPIHYLNAVKVERACRMLRSGEVTTAQVARLLGFYDLPYFHKIFRRYTGKTPGEYCREG